MKTALKSVAITVLAGIVLIAVYEGYQEMKARKEAKKLAEANKAPTAPADKPK